MKKTRIVLSFPPSNVEEPITYRLIKDYDLDGETVLLAPAQGFYATPGKGKNEVRLAFMLKAEDLQRSLDILRSALTAYGTTHN